MYRFRIPFILIVLICAFTNQAMMQTGAPPVDRGRPFPEPVYETGIVGEDLSAPAWEGIEIGEDSCPNWIVIHSDVDNDWDIYRLGPTGGNDVSDNLSQSFDSADIQPSRSPDSQWIVFTSNRESATNWELWLGKTDGSEQHRITYNSGVDLNPAWGTGNLIAFESNRDGNWEIYTFDVSNGSLTRITDHSANDIDAVWSADGTALYFMSDRNGEWDIFRYTVSSGELEQVTDSGSDDTSPALSKDGELLGWLKQGANGIFNLWMQDLTTGETRQMTDLGVNVGYPVFSPDSSIIVFDIFINGDYEVFGIDLETGVQENITRTLTNERSPSFKCGTNALIYQAQQPNGTWDLFQTDPLPVEENGAENIGARLTNTLDNEVYPMNTPTNEDYSREGRMPEAGN